MLYVILVFYMYITSEQYVWGEREKKDEGKRKIILLSLALHSPPVCVKR
jgi:hypothetical protein